MLHESCSEYTDLLEIEPQEEQELWFSGTMTEAFARHLAGTHPARTLRNDAGLVVACCGVVPLHDNLAHAWTILSAHASPHMFGIVKAVRGLMDTLPQRRLEMSVRSGFTRGHKWARLLGFACEGVMRCYGVNGDDHHLYARVRR